MDELKGVAILWASGWWDGPRTGIASRGDRHYWFEAVFNTAEDEYEYPRRLLLYEITDQELEVETERHKRFEEIVGNKLHCFHLPPEERYGPTQPVEEWARFYEDERNQPARYDDRPVAGWFFPDGA